MSQAEAPDQLLELPAVLKQLVSDGLLASEQSNRIIGKARSREQSLAHPLIYIAAQQADDARHQGKTLDLNALSEWLAEWAGLPLAHIDPLKISVPAVTGVMSFEFARRHGILCIDITDKEVVVAVAQPFTSLWVDDIEKISGKAVCRVLANPADIEKYTVEFYSLARSVFGAGKSTGQNRRLSGNFEQLLELGSLSDPSAQDQHVVNIVDWLLQYAFDQRASDIHIEPRRDKGRIRFRIDGILHQVYDLPGDVMSAMTSRLKILGRMDVSEKRRPQDGRVKTKTQSGDEVELRLSTMPTVFGEKMVMRIFDPQVLLQSFKELGLTGHDYDTWQAIIARPHGIVLVTGPTGSGKTTTLYSTLKVLATENVNVCTIEDPIEMVEESFNQTQVQSHIGLDFATGIRTLMRQDPDIIMVGEIRDFETAEMAVQAALTGHLVLSTLHTNDAPTAITRLLELGIPAHLLKVTLNGVMAQRLVRTLCHHCREQGEVDLDAWKQLILPWSASPPAHMYRPVGCLECRGTGYLGRQGIYEIMPFSETLSNLITDKCDIVKLRLQAVKEGMKTLRLSGAQKVGAGTCSVEEVMRVAPDIT